MKKRIAFVAAILATICLSVVLADEGKVYKVWPEAEELAVKSWRPMVVAFVQQGNSEFMGSSNSVMGDRAFNKIFGKIILLQVDLVQQGNDTSLKVANDKNNGAMNKLLGQAKMLPIFVVAGPDMKALKIWEKADPDVVKKEVVPILKNALKLYKPLDDSDIKKAEKLFKQAEKLEEEGKLSNAIKTLKEIVRMNKKCGLATQAQEIIDRLEAEEKGEDTTGFGEEDEEESEEDAEEIKPESLGKTVAIIKTDFGDIEVELLLEKAPTTCEHFINMAKNGIYEGSSFGYIERNKLIQCIPDSSKDLPEEIDADFSDEKHDAGMVAMAHGLSSQKIRAEFYIVLKPYADRDGQYPVFGKIVKGLAVAKAIASSKTLNNEPLNKVGISKIEIIE